VHVLFVGYDLVVVGNCERKMAVRGHCMCAALVYASGFVDVYDVLADYSSGV